MRRACQNAIAESVCISSQVGHVGLWPAGSMRMIGADIFNLRQGMLQEQNDGKKAHEDAGEGRASDAGIQSGRASQWQQERPHGYESRAGLGNSLARREIGVSKEKVGGSFEWPASNSSTRW